MAEPVTTNAAVPVNTSEVSPLLPIPRLSDLILTQSCPSSVLVQYLVSVPNSCDAESILHHLCLRDYAAAFSYLLSLPIDHWHRDVMKDTLNERLLNESTKTVLALTKYIPELSALTFDDTTNTWQAFVGPLTNMETARWDIHDWFFQLLHAKQMKGQLLFNTIALSLFPRISLRFL